MKKKIAYLLFIVSSIILVFGCLNINLIGKGADLNSSESQSDVGNKIILSTFNLEYSLPKTPEKIMVYKTIDPKFSKEDVKTLAEVFEINGEIIDRNKQFIAKEGETTFKVLNKEYGPNYRILEVFTQTGTGYLRFTNTAKLYPEENAFNLPPEDVAIKKAEDFLRNNNLFPENSFFSRVGYFEYEKYNSNGITIEKGVSAMSVTFGFTIDGKKVEGPGAKIKVTFGNNSEIIGFLKSWREIEPDEKKTTITPEKAFENFKNYWPDEIVDSEQLEKADSITEVNIKDIYLTYYASPGCEPQSYIEPVFIFKGNYRIIKRNGQEVKNCPTCVEDFKIIIPAVL